jgi:hypothetical protein
MTLIIGAFLLAVVLCEWLSLTSAPKNEPPVVRLGQGEYAREWWA